MNAELFWSKVNKTEESDDLCWEWAGRVCPKGYGYFDRSQGRALKWKERAHRQAWMLVKGLIPDGLHVLHRCDNRRCVRVSHLWLGTHDDNMQDKVTKGRQARNVHVVGEMQGNAVLTEEKVLGIMAQLKKGTPQAAIGRMFGIRQDHVSRINTGHLWSHVTGLQKKTREK